MFFEEFSLASLAVVISKKQKHKELRISSLNWQNILSILVPNLTWKAPPDLQLLL